jgi:hypothetical protein
VPLLLPLALVLMSNPVPGEVRVFADWAVGCDNTSRCTAGSLAPVGQDASPLWTVEITRDAGLGNDRPVIAAARLPIPAERYGSIELLRFFDVDGRRVVDLDDQRDDAGRPMRDLNEIRAMAQGHDLALIDLHGKTILHVSLAGLAAALRYIDDRQGRANTVTAFVALGPRVPDTVSVAIKRPTVAQQWPTGKPVRPTARAVADMRRQAGCKAPDRNSKVDAHALGRRQTLVLIPCAGDPHGASSAAFILARGQASAAGFDSPPVLGRVKGVYRIGTPRFSGGDLWDRRSLRPAGDCGTFQSYRWDGRRFRLRFRSDMPVCRGNTNFLPTWQTMI